MRTILICALTLLALCFAPALQAAPTIEQTATPEAILRMWDEQSRFNVLIAGIDRRPNQNETLSVRTDAIVVASFDPATQSIGLLHIPRDLFFVLPPDASGNPLPMVRVNTLLLRGEESQEGYGPIYMMDTLGYNFGMYIHSYVLFDFEAFIAIVDALGGIDITTTYTISDPTYPDMDYGFDPFYLPKGEHRLDGEMALKYARTRHGDNDYVRGARQLQVLEAIGERATSVEVLPLLLARAPQLLEDLEGKLYTDLPFEDAVALAIYASSIPLENVRTGSINQAYITYTVNEGDTVAIPDREKLADLLIDVFGEGYGG
jgi:polyisoprenyl-teichoic acid--peptidoglycan teichoic acid transferase